MQHKTHSRTHRHTTGTPQAQSHTHRTYLARTEVSGSLNVTADLNILMAESLTIDADRAALVKSLLSPMH